MYLHFSINFFNHMYWRPRLDGNFGGPSAWLMQDDNSLLPDGSRQWAFLLRWLCCQISFDLTLYAKDKAE